MRRRAALPWWLRLLVLTALLVALEAVLESFGLRPLSSSVSRPGSLLGNASDEGALGVLVLGPLAVVAGRTREPWLITGALAALVTIVLSGSRGALLGGAVVVVTLFVALGARRARVPVGIALALLAVGTLAVPATRDRVLESSPLSASTASGRLALWDDTANLLSHHLGLGVGPSGFIDAVPTEFTRGWELTYGPQTPPDSPHDWVLQASAAGGIPLAALAVALATVIVIVGRRRFAREDDEDEEDDARALPQPSIAENAAFAGLWAGLLGYGCCLLLTPTGPGTTPLAAFFAGALVALLPRARPRGSRVAHLTVGACAVGLGLLLAMAAIAEIPLRSAVVDVATGNYSSAVHEFTLAEDLRPWDAELKATAGHAFVVAAELDVASGRAPGLGAPASIAIDDGVLPVADEVASFPDSLQALEDQALLDELTSQPATAASLLSRAQRLAPADPVVAYDQGVIELDLGRARIAVGDLRRSTESAPKAAPTWRVLADAYRSLGLRRLAAAASRHAADLAAP